MVRILSPDHLKRRIYNEKRSFHPEARGTPEKNFEEEISLLKDQLLRALVEVDNTQKRAHKEKEDTQKYAISSFARDLLGISDTLEQALEASPPQNDKKMDF